MNYKITVGFVIILFNVDKFRKFKALVTKNVVLKMNTNFTEFCGKFSRLISGSDMQNRKERVHQKFFRKLYHFKIWSVKFQFFLKIVLLDA